MRKYRASVFDKNSNVFKEVTSTKKYASIWKGNTAVKAGG